MATKYTITTNNTISALLLHQQAYCTEFHEKATKKGRKQPNLRSNVSCTISGTVHFLDAVTSKIWPAVSGSVPSKIHILPYYTSHGWFLIAWLVIGSTVYSNPTVYSNDDDNNATGAKKAEHNDPAHTEQTKKRTGAAMNNTDKHNKNTCRWHVTLTLNTSTNNTPIHQKPPTTTTTGNANDNTATLASVIATTTNGTHTKMILAISSSRMVPPPSPRAAAGSAPGPPGYASSPYLNKQHHPNHIVTALQHNNSNRHTNQRKIRQIVNKRPMYASNDLPLRHYRLLHVMICACRNST